MRTLRLTGALLAAMAVHPPTAAQTPWKTAATVSKPIIGALDPHDPTALVFVAPGEAVFGVRIVGAALARRGPHAAEGAYGELSWRFPPRSDLSPSSDVRLRWARQGNSSAAAILDVSAPCDVVLEPYFPFGITAHYRPSETLRGIVAWSGTRTGNPGTCHFRLETDRRSRTPSIAEVRAGIGPRLRFRLAGGERLALKAQVGDKPIETIRVAVGQIETALEGARAKAGDESDALGSRLQQMLAYMPGSGSTYLASQPPGGNITGPDAWLSALAAAVRSKALAHDIVYMLCETQTVTGCILGFVDDYGEASDWSQPPLGSYCVLELYERFRDRGLLEYAYPKLLRWYRWWVEDTGTGMPRRDGNGDGLLEWGGPSIEDAKAESAMAESPLWDEAGFDETARTMTVNAIDLNSFRALDARCLARMAEILKRPEEAAALSLDYETMRDRVNAVLWDDEAGVYFSRHWDGRLEKREAVASLYPLLAGIPTRVRAESLVRRALGDPGSWAGPVLPTVSPDDPAYDPAGPWRGAVSPLSNYIVHAGLKRYRYNQEAAELARRSAALVDGASGPGEGWRNWYDTSTGEGIGEGWQLYGVLLSLAGE